MILPVLLKVLFFITTFLKGGEWHGGKKRGERRKRRSQDRGGERQERKKGKKKTKPLEYLIFISPSRWNAPLGLVGSSTITYSLLHLYHLC